MSVLHESWATSWYWHGMKPITSSAAVTEGAVPNIAVRQAQRMLLPEFRA